jgi:hypothetical protein
VQDERPAQEEAIVERVRVQWRRDGEIVPALREGDVLGWEYLAPDTGTAGRSYLLLDLGVKLTIPPIWNVGLAIVTREDDLYRVVNLDFARH